MTRFLSTIFLFFGFNSLAQTASIDTLFIGVLDKFTNGQSNKLKFPIIKTGNIKIDSLITADLKNRLTNNEYRELSTDSTIIKWADDQIVSLEFEVTYNQKGLLSLNIIAEGCGSYCTVWTDYFNYSTHTGMPLSLSDVADVSGSGYFLTRRISTKSRKRN